MSHRYLAVPMEGRGIVAAWDRGNAEVHEGANHGFAVPGGAYHEAAASRSYEQALAMFAKGLT